MCWLSSEAIPVVQNTGEDKVLIYKVLRRNINSNSLYAYYRCTPYELNRLYEVEMENPRKVNLDYSAINRGLHCYSSKCVARQIDDGIAIYEDGKRPIRMIYEDDFPDLAVVAEGYIPPNTCYYINKHNEIVTSKLILTKLYPRINSMETVTIEQVCDWIRSSSYTDTIKNLTDCTAEDIINDFLEHLTNSEES